MYSMVMVSPFCALSTPLPGLIVVFVTPMVDVTCKSWPCKDCVKTVCSGLAGVVLDGNDGRTDGVERNSWYLYEVDSSGRTDKSGSAKSIRTSPSGTYARLETICVRSPPLLADHHSLS